MTIALRAAGTILAGTTTVSPAYPAGIVAGDAVFLGATWKTPTPTAPALTGWTKVIDQSVGAGTAGAGTGPQRLAVYRKDTVAGGETGSVAVTPVGGSNVVEAGIIAFSKTLADWTITYDYGSDSTAAANISCTSQAQIAQAAGDLLAGFIGTAANTNMGSSTFTTTGVTYGTAVEHADVGSTNGDDIRASWISRPVTAGTPSAVTTFTSTITGTLTGGLGFVRLREAAASGTTYQVDGVSSTTTTATGDVGRRLGAAGTSVVTATSSGVATSRLGAAGVSAATATATGSVVGRLAVAGIAAAIATATGDVSILPGVAEPVTHTIAGVSTSTSTSTGSVAARLAAAGVSAATATTTGTVSRRLAIAGTSAAAASSTGSVTRRAAVAGVSTAAASSTGVATSRLDVAGTSTASSSSSGTVETIAPVLAPTQPAPAERTELVWSESRHSRVGVDRRLVMVEVETRTVAVPDEQRLVRA